MSLKLFNQGYTPEEIKKIKAQAASSSYEQELQEQWRESEHILNILRSLKGAAKAPEHEAFQKWKEVIGLSKKDVMMPYAMSSISRSSMEKKYGSANAWFADMFPAALEAWGPAFMEATFVDEDHFLHTIPVELNQDFFAAVIGGRQELGHQVVWYPPEAAWYFFDPAVEAFCPTTEPKLKLLVSNYLMRCAQGCSSLVDIRPLVTTFRKDNVLAGIIDTAKALMEADRTFFEGKDGRRRLVEGKVIEPNAEPSYRAFVKRGIVRDPTANLTLPDAFHRYYQYCRDQGQQPLTRPEFKDLVAEVIREEFNLGLRHDVKDERGKQQHGWTGIGCRLPSQEAVGLN